ncbi:MBL fold metallo-hydrolase [Streptomyces sp. Inha503]|uniref:MBL fold metallo-hydrolase n=1 Tax=Streptomyces sp. Inha503 TaxID=3383314 RepID=UPI0039A0F18A
MTPGPGNVALVIADNSDQYTLAGTNTWIVMDTRRGCAVLVDPGPHDPAHLRAIDQQLALHAVRLEAIVVTHGHDDHSDAVDAAHRRWDVPVHAHDARHCRNAPLLRGGSVVGSGKAELHCIYTPGHTSDSVSFYAPSARAVLTGDTVLGGSTTMLDFPDGSLDSYLSSLETLRDTAVAESVQWILPGHGHVCTDVIGDVQAVAARRRERLGQVEQLLLERTRTDEELVDVIYPGITPALREGALQNTAAARAFLAARQTSHGC